MHQITFFPVGNGDTSLIEADITVLTDINYRVAAQDDNQEDIFDIGEPIKKACNTKDGYQLDVFVNTHPDKDHVSGFSDLFHTGSPSKWGRNSDKILAKEIWVTSYTANLANPTDQAKPFIDEVRRRKGLSGSDANKDGNILKIISSEGAHSSGELNENLSWLALAPNIDEVEAAKDDDGERNNSSLVIRWAYNGTKASKIMLAGDAEYQVWERLYEESSDEDLEWHILLSPHHCSRTPFSFKNENGDYENSDSAWDALTHIQGKGFIVASSKPIKDDDDNPPHYEAKNRYIQLLNENGTNGKTRFFNPETHSNKDKAEPVVFKLGDDGAKRSVAPVISTKSKGAASTTTQYGK